MANEILMSSLGDQRTAEVFTGRVQMLRADRTTLLGHPALNYIGRINGRNTDTLTEPQVGLGGYDLPASSSDNTEVTYTALTDAQRSVTVAPFRKAYAAGDLARLTDGNGVVNPAMFADDAFRAAQHKITDVFANLVGDFSTVVGTSGADMTLEDHFDAFASLDAANADGPIIAVYHSRQWNDLLKDLALNTGGGIVFTPATAELIAKRGRGYKGNLGGVDIFVSNRVPTANAGADRAGGMFCAGGINWGDGVCVVDDPTRQALIGDLCMFEFSRVPRFGLSEYIMHQMLGASIGDDGCGVAVITDA